MAMAQNAWYISASEATATREKSKAAYYQPKGEQGNWELTIARGLEKMYSVNLARVSF